MTEFYLYLHTKNQQALGQTVSEQYLASWQTFSKASDNFLLNVHLRNI